MIIQNDHGTIFLTCPTLNRTWIKRPEPGEVYSRYSETTTDSTTPTASATKPREATSQHGINVFTILDQHPGIMTTTVIPTTEGHLTLVTECIKKIDKRHTRRWARVDNITDWNSDTMVSIMTELSQKAFLEYYGREKNFGFIDPIRRK